MGFPPKFAEGLVSLNPSDSQISLGLSIFQKILG
jgi:hypothetical protein